MAEEVKVVGVVRKRLYGRSKFMAVRLSTAVANIYLTIALCGVVVLLVGIKSCAGADSDPSTLDGKVVFGYQGWFNTPSDGANVGWRHWSHDVSFFNGSNANVDVWPDMSEYTETEETGMHYADGTPARVFSSLQASTVEKHFEWMRDYDLDGVCLQRFLGELKDPRFFAIRNNVTKNVMAAAEQYGRTFSIMYDISGVNNVTLVDDLKADWNYLTQVLKVDQSPAYQHHDGKIVVTVWGLGFTDRPGTPQQAIQTIEFLHQANCFVLGGVPFHWRDENGDSKADYLTAYLQFDGIEPWSIGRYNNIATFENSFTELTVEDKNLTFSNGKYFAPVIYPGGSNANQIDNMSGFNSVPRLGGAFFTAQANAVRDRLQREKTFVYIAMFDELDEGTAMLKAAVRKTDTPSDGNFLYLNIDNGVHVTSDHYLRLASDLSKQFKSPTCNMPVDH